MNALNRIDHIVVLMMENRSFDQMLGYLRLKGGRQDVDGLTGNEVNVYKGKPHSPQRMASTEFRPDPCHEWDCVAGQLAGGNSGFIETFAKQKDKPKDPWRIMNYHDASDLLVYDHLAREGVICDRWFSCIPGPTQPNRAYSLAGTSQGVKKNQAVPFGAYTARTIFEYLPSSATWRYYSHDIAGLRFFDRYKVSTGPIDKIHKFFEAAKNGNLPNLSWIDPNFGLTYEEDQNDDHPNADVRKGQSLVAKVYNALLGGGSNLWSKTLFVIAYDEHGGFYDHVDPTAWTPTDDHQDFRHYGVRVPALVLSPWVARGRCYGSTGNGLPLNKLIFDHTSILKTILMRFCTAGGNVPMMTARVHGANDLGQLLTESQPRNDYTMAPAVPYVSPMIDRKPAAGGLSTRALEALPRTKAGKRATRGKRTAIAPQPQRKLTEMQRAMKALARKAVAEGVPPEKL